MGGSSIPPAALWGKLACSVDTTGRLAVLCSMLHATFLFRDDRGVWFLLPGKGIWRPEGEEKGSTRDIE
jgi:hypothetical protein